MPNNCLLTVVVTSYNYENYIKENLDSLINQTYKDFNIIVIDDGSKDNSVKIIRKYEKKYSNILFLQHENGQNKGLCKTMQVALLNVRTPYVAFCESDDYWDKNHVKNLIDFIHKNPQANMIFNKIKVENYSHNSEYEAYVQSTNKFLLEKNGKNIFALMSSNYMPTFSAACIKTSKLKKCDFNSYYPQYLDFWLWRQLCVNNKIYFVNDSITYWRKHDESYDMKEHIEDIQPFLEASDKLIKKRETLFNKFRKMIYHKLQIHKTNKKITKYRLCGITFVRKEKSDFKKKWNILGVKFCTHIKNKMNFPKNAKKY